MRDREGVEIAARARIAIAACKDHPDIDIDDEPFVAALASLGVAAEPVVWTASLPDRERHALCLLRTTWDYHERAAAFLD